MAQTIQIKRSSTTTAPSSLASGELAYSTKTGVQKLYYGDGTDVLAIGGKSYTDKLDGIENNANNYILPLATDTVKGGVELFSNTDQTEAANSVTTTSGRTYGIQLNSSDQMVVNVPWVNTEYTAGTGLSLSGTTFNANVDGTNSEAAQASTATTDRTYKVQVDGSDNLVVNVPWSDTTTANTLSATLAAGNASGSNNLVMGDDQNIQFGASNSANLQISYDTSGSGTAKIREVGGGGLLIQGEALTLRGDDGVSGMNIIPASGQNYDDISFQTGPSSTIQLSVTASGVSFATGQSVTSIETSTSLSSSNTSLSTTGAVKSYVDGKLGNFTLSGDTLSTSGATVTVDDAVIITGDLTVQGTTTTIDSTTVTIEDPIFTLGGDTPPSSDDNLDRGIEFRWHNATAAKLGFFGFDDSTGEFTFIPDATNSSNVMSGTKGTANFGTLKLDTDLAVAYGGTGRSSFTTNGIAYGNGTSAMGVTAAGVWDSTHSVGQLLSVNSSGVPTWTNTLDGGTF